MNPDLEKLFDHAVSLTGTEREEFIAKNCSDPGLRRELEKLLASDAGASTFLQDAVMDAASSLLQALALSPGQRLGPYRVLSVIGRGGMGLVYLAERADGKFEQRVALKVLQSGPDQPFVAEQLQRECRILASLEHPNIARVLDADVTENGVPYFVMEYVDGQPIDRYCDEHKLSLRERLRVLLPVCDAVHVAHQKLIVHRDLKPENILVTRQCIPKLLDFGIAKVLTEVPVSAQNTATQVMTPEYASPEQARGEPVTTGTDVYSLGGVLYKLLTGRAPHRLADRSPLAMARAICDEEVPRPSELRRELTGDVEHILLMALRKEPQHRYRSVDQFGADIENFLEQKPVIARAASLWYRSGKYLRRHWLGMSAACSVLLALTIGIGVATWQARRAERRFADVRHLANVFLFDFEQSIHDVPGATKARQLLVKTSLDYLERLTKEASGDPKLTKELAAAYEKVGDIQGSPSAGNVGNAADAVRTYQQSLLLLQSLHESGFLGDLVELDLARVLTKLAKVQSRRTKDVAGAMQNVTEAVSLMSAFVKLHTEDRVATKQLIDSELELARTKQMANDYKGAAELLEKAVGLQESQLASTPRDRSATEQLAGVYISAAMQLTIAKDYIRSLRYAQKAVTAYEQLAAEDPTNGNFRRQLMIALTETGTDQSRLAHDNGQSADAAINVLRRAYAISGQEVSDDPANREALLDRTTLGIHLADAIANADSASPEALAIIRNTTHSAQDLVDLDPANAVDRLELAYCYSYEARMLDHRGSVAQSIRAYETAARLYQELATQAPKDTNVRDPQVYNWSLLGDMYAKQGDWKRAHQIYSTAIAVTDGLMQDTPVLTEYLTDLRKSDRKALQQLSR